MAEVTTIVSKSGFRWIDIFNPKKSDIENIAKEYNLHKTSVQDCLDPEHLPKYEKHPTYIFMILRAYDEKCSAESDTVQELTRKIAIFYTEKLLVTIHRKDQAFLAALREKWAQEMDSKDGAAGTLLLFDLLKNIFQTYEVPIDLGLTRLEEYEMQIFSAPGTKPFSLRQGYYLKRAAFVFKRVLRMSADAVHKLSGADAFANTPLYQDLRETLDSSYFYADELEESTNSLLNLYLSMEQKRTNEASHRINEVIRILTIFSVFFMPLNFIASIYGMNFEYMPELKMVGGYPMILAFMLATAGTIYLWFRRKGWL
jgi:magnesium transporter